MAFDLGPYEQYHLAAIVLVGTYGALALVLWLAQWSAYAPFIRSFRGIAQNFLTVINVIFALNLAFLANDTWNARDRGRDAVYQEAGSLRNILDLARELPQPAGRDVAAAVVDYARASAAAEWPQLARRQESGEAAAALEALIARVAAASIGGAVDPIVAAQLLGQALDVRATRELRIALSQTHVNPLKWLGMAFLGFLTLISIAMVHVDLPRAQLLSVLLFATAAAPTAAIILIHGNPFQHPFAVSPAPIADIVAWSATASPAR
ncbi:MAG: hypothetical protein ACFCUO_03785 [Rhodospirillales bacterium]